MYHPKRTRVMTISKEELKEIIARAMTLGMATQQWIYSPPNDNISMNAAMRYLARLGYKNPKKIIKTLVERKELHVRRSDGKDGNAKMHISSVELQRALLEMKIKEINILNV